MFPADPPELCPLALPVVDVPLAFMRVSVVVRVIGKNFLKMKV